MSLKSFIARLYAEFRARQIQQVSTHPHQAQSKVFDSLIRIGKTTSFGKDFHFQNIRSVQDFQRQVPVADYEFHKGYFDRIYQGESDVMWQGKPLYLAKTSGTTSGAKYIPITKDSIRYQIAGARDTLLMYIAENKNADFLDGKMMFLSGSPELETNAYGMKVGRLSGIVHHFVPNYLLRNRVPTHATNCIEDWEAKVAQIVKETVTQDLRLISGIPPWVQMFFEEATRQTGKQPMEIWKNLQLFIQGGVDFTPYLPVFEKILGAKKPPFLELFPASEGFFAFQNSLTDNGMLLLLDRGIFYEFIPLEEYGKPNAPRLTLQEVEMDKQYAMIISTNAGLWAYDLGDTVKFTSLAPYKIRVSGRVKHFLSAFGEHVITEEVNQALLRACEQTGAGFQEFTVAPFVSPLKGASYHEWFVEFTQLPQNWDNFIEVLDAALQAKNPYYKDLREGNLLKPPKINILALHATRDYMKSVGKLGGQNKFPRLTNNRKIADALQSWVKN